MNLNDAALDYLVDDLENLNINDDTSQYNPKKSIPEDDVSLIYSEKSSVNEEKSVVSLPKPIKKSKKYSIDSNSSISISNISESDLGSDIDNDIEEEIEQDTQPARAAMLVKINSKSKAGYNTRIKCTMNTPLVTLKEEYEYQKQSSRYEKSLANYKSFINNGVSMIEWLSGYIPNSFDIDLDGFSRVWQMDSNQDALTDIVEELELKYGSFEMAPEMQLGMMLFKSIYLVVNLNRSGKKVQSQPEPKGKKTKSKLKPPSAAIKKKVEKNKKK